MSGLLSRLLLCGCALAAASAPQEVVELAAAREADGVFDRYEPGKHLGKQHNFEPIMTWTKLGGSGGSARVRVTHANSEDDYIEAFYAKDQDGQIVAGTMLTSSSKPDVKIDIPEGVYKLTAFSVGSQHGVWKSLQLDLSWTIGRAAEGRIMSSTPPLKEGALVEPRPTPKDEL